jgi:hypothetical protein
MTDKMKSERLNPYDLAAMRRAAASENQKVSIQIHQPYTLSSSERISKPASSNRNNEGR